MTFLRTALLAVVVAAIAAPAVAQASFPGQNGRIAFSEDHALYTMKSDGTDLQGILFPPPRRGDPAWSPDGTQLAYRRGSGGGGQDLVVANADGSGETVIASGGAEEPAWSPDGTKVAYEAIPNPGTNFREIFVVAATGGTPTQLTFDSNSFSPTWSPDGARIAFVRLSRPPDGMGDPPKYAIWTMNANGSNVVRITGSDQLNDLSPDWSPDGSRIVFSRFSSVGGPSQLVVKDVNSGGEAILLNEYAVYPDWAPDATRVLYLDIDGNLKTVKADGTNVVLVRAPDSTFATYPGADWQPVPYAGYARPKGATPMRVSLVPAYAPCDSPNHQHGPPLSFGSCNPPAQESAELTVGTPDANAQQSGMSGFVLYGTVVGDPDTPADEADIALRAEITDVRVKSTLDDYAGEVEAQTTARLTDRNGDGTEPATVTDVLFPLAMPCAPDGRARHRLHMLDRDHARCADPRRHRREAAHDHAARPGACDRRRARRRHRHRAEHRVPAPGRLRPVGRAG